MLTVFLHSVVATVLLFWLLTQILHSYFFKSLSWLVVDCKQFHDIEIKDSLLKDLYFIFSCSFGFIYYCCWLVILIVVVHDSLGEFFSNFLDNRKKDALLNPKPNIINKRGYYYFFFTYITLQFVFFLVYSIALTVQA